MSDSELYVVSPDDLDALADAVFDAQEEFDAATKCKACGMSLADCLRITGDEADVPSGLLVCCEKCTHESASEVTEGQR